MICSSIKGRKFDPLCFLLHCVSFPQTGLAMSHRVLTPLPGYSENTQLPEVFIPLSGVTFAGSFSQPPFNINAKAPSYSQAILIGRCKRECSVSPHVFLFWMGIFTIGCFTGDWMKSRSWSEQKYGGFKLSLWYPESPLANPRYRLNDIYWALLQRLIDLSYLKATRNYQKQKKKSGRWSHCSKREPHIHFADIWASCDG